MPMLNRLPGAIICNTMVESMPNVVISDNSAIRFAAIHVCLCVLTMTIKKKPLKT